MLSRKRFDTLSSEARVKVVNGTVLRAEGDMPLIIPEGAVVVPGARAVTKGKGQEWGLSVYTPVIVKYRDEKTELSLVLEDLIR